MLRWLLRDDGPYGPDLKTEELSGQEPNSLVGRLRWLATVCYHAGPPDSGAAPDDFYTIFYGAATLADALEFYLSADPVVRTRQAALVRESFDPPPRLTVLAKEFLRRFPG
jgi:hypothetical protein